MTSTGIYTPITPTYLYIKQHSVTGLKYFGKTIKNPYKYQGSGNYWIKHIKKYGKEHVVTLWVSELYTDASIIEIAEHFSKENNIVESKDWANLVPENGIDGWIPGQKHSENTKQKLSSANKGQIPWNKGVTTGISPWNKNKKGSQTAWNKGLTTSEESKAKMSASHKGKTPWNKGKVGAQTAWNKGKPSPLKGIPKPQITCPHCNKTGGASSMKQWHFDKCKFKLNQ